MMQSIEKLYEVFSKYKARLLSSSPITPIRDQQILLSTPLRQLTEDQLSPYDAKALTTWGDESDFKYFLPRLLEVCFENREILLGKLTYAHWASWPDEERSALKVFLNDYWIAALSQHLPGGPNIETHLCALAQAEEDLLPYLKVWENFGDASNESAYLESALKQLGELISRNAPVIKRRHGLSNAFWKEVPKQEKQVVDWLLSRDTRQRFQYRWEDRQCSPYIGADSGWLEDVIAKFDDLQSG